MKRMQFFIVSRHWIIHAYEIWSRFGTKSIRPSIDISYNRKKTVQDEGNALCAYERNKVSLHCVPVQRVHSLISPSICLESNTLRRRTSFSKHSNEMLSRRILIQNRFELKKKSMNWFDLMTFFNLNFSFYPTKTVNSIETLGEFAI